MDIELAKLALVVDTESITPALARLKELRPAIKEAADEADRLASANKRLAEAGNTATASVTRRTAATASAVAAEKDLDLSLRSQLTALTTLRSAMAGDIQLSMDSAVQRRVLNSLLATGGERLDANTVSLAKNVEALKQEIAQSTTLLNLEKGLTDSAIKQIQAREQLRVARKGVVDGMRAEAGLSQQIQAAAQAETDATKFLQEKLAESSRFRASIADKNARVVEEEARRTILAQEKQMASIRNLDHAEALRMNKAVDSVAAAQTQAGIFQAAGVRSPQQVSEELNSLRQAKALLLEMGPATEGYAAGLSHITARTNVLTEGNARARGAIRETAAAMASLAFEAAGAAFLVTAVGGALAAPALFGVSMLKRVEDAQTGIAGILMSMGTLDGKALTFEQSMAASGEYVKKIQEDSLKFGIEMGKLVEVNQAAMSGGLAAMLTLDQIQKVATAGAIAVSSLGLNSQQYVQEVRDLVAGGIQPASSTLARSIGVTDALLKQWKAEGPAKLVGELTSRLEGFVLVADKVRASTLTGAWDILQARLAVLLSDQEGFGALKKVVIDVANYIGDFDPISNKFTLNPDVVSMAQAYWEAIKAVGGAIVVVVELMSNLTPLVAKLAQGVQLIGVNARMLVATIGTAFEQLIALAKFNFSDIVKSGRDWSATMDKLNLQLEDAAFKLVGMDNSAQKSATTQDDLWNQISGNAGAAAKSFSELQGMYDTDVKQKAEHDAKVLALNEQVWAAQIAQGKIYYEAMAELDAISKIKQTATSGPIKGAERPIKAAADAAMKEIELIAASYDKWIASLDNKTQKRQAATKVEQSAIDKFLASMQEEIDLYGKSTEEIVRYNAAKAGGNVIQQEQAVAASKQLEFLKDMTKQEEANAKLKERAGAREARRAQDLIDEQQKAHEDMWKSIEGVAHDTWTRVWTEGSAAFTNIGKTIKSAILDMLYQMTVKQWIIGVSMSGTGTAASAAVSGAASGGGVGSWLNAGQSMWSAFSGGMATGLGSIATSAGQLFGSAALTEFGAGASAIGGGGVASGIGGAIGLGETVAAALPWVAGALAIGSLLGGSNGLFGKSKSATGPETLAGTFGATGFSGQYQQPWYQSGGLFSASGGGMYTRAVAAEQVSAFSLAASGVKAAFDALATTMGVATSSLAGWSYGFNQVVNDQAQATAVITDMANSMGDKLIPELRAFKLDGESLADTAVRMRDTFIATDAILALVGQTFTEVGTASMAVRSNLVGLFGGVEKASAAMQGYYQAFYTENERAMDGWRQMATQLRYLGVNVIPTSNAGFRKLVEAQDLSTQAGQEMFATLVGMAPAFDQLTKATATLEQQSVSLNDSLSKLSTAGFSTLVDYTRAVQLRQNQSAAAAGAGVAATAIAEAPTLSDIQTQKDTAAATQAAQNKVTAALEAFAAVKASSDALREKVRGQMLSDYQQETPTQGYIGWRYPGVAQADITAYWAEYSKKQAAYQAIEALGAPLPAFAAGGFHTGGLRLVGENGPELEYTGPSAISSNADTKAMLSNKDVVDAINQLRDELRAGQIAISGAAQRTSKILDRWDGNGMPEVREAA